MNTLIRVRKIRKIEIKFAKEKFSELIAMNINLRNYGKYDQLKY